MYITIRTISFIPIKFKPYSEVNLTFGKGNNNIRKNIAILITLVLRQPLQNILLLSIHLRANILVLSVFP